MKINKTIKRALAEMNAGARLLSKVTPAGEQAVLVEHGRAVAHVPRRQAVRMVAAGLVGEGGRISPLGRAALVAVLVAALHVVAVLTAYADGALDALAVALWWLA